MARKTVLVCDNCGKEVDEAQGAALRVTYSDARRGSKVADLCDDCAGEDAGPRGRPPRPPAEGRKASRRRARETRRGGPGTRPAAALRWEGGAVPPRRACERGQSRAPARALSGAPRRRARSDRAERVGRRPRRARPARPLRLPARRRDRHLRRPLRAARPRATRPAPGRDRRASARSIVRRALAAASLDGLARSARTAGFADSLLRTLGELESGLLDPARPRRRPRAALRRLPRRARPARRSGTATCCAAARPSGSQTDLDAWHGEPVFAYGFEDLTGAEWSLLEALSGPRRGAGLAAVRAGPRRLRVARAHRRRPLGARRRPHRGARAARRPSTRTRRSRISSARSSRSRRRRRRSSTAPCASSRAPARAARSSSSARSCSRCSAAAPPPEQIALVAPSLEQLARAARDGARRPRRPVRDRVARAARRDAVRPRAAAAPALRVGRRRAPRALRVPALAVLRARALVGRLRRGPAARPRDPHAGARRGGGREAARGADPALAELRGRRVADRGRRAR